MERDHRGLEVFESRRMERFVLVFAGQVVL
jgi:hypothetical protein